MSESEFLKQQMDEFLASHSREDGWKVYEFSDALVGVTCLRFLVDFVRDRYPDIVKRRQTVDEARSSDMAGDEGVSHFVEPRSEWDRGKQLDIFDWAGHVDIQWHGEPIHYMRFCAPDHLGRMEKRTMAAAQSNAAFRDIHKALKGFVEERYKTKIPRIQVINDVDIPFTDVTWDDVILPTGLADDIRSNVEAFFSEHGRARYHELGIPYRRGFIFAGPPGCGKTLTLKVLAKTIEVPVVALQVRATLKDSDLGRAFDAAAQRAPAMLMFEDLDRLVTCQDVGVSYFLNLLDGLRVTEGIMVIATANYPQNLDPALSLRPSRFDRLWRFPLPDLSQRRAMLEKNGGKFFSAQALDEAAKGSGGFSMAFVQEIVVSALLGCVHNNGKPADKDLLCSLATLKQQRRATVKEDEAHIEQDGIGFGILDR